MKFVPNKISLTVGRQILKTQKHSPRIMFVAGVVGVVATTVLVAKATLKLEETLEENQAKLVQAKELHEDPTADYTDSDYQHDVVYLHARAVIAIVKLYGPAVLVGCASIALLTGSHNILSRRNASLTAAYAALEKSFDKYRERVRNELGVDKEREFMFPTDTIETTDEKGKVVKKTVVSADIHSPYAKFFDKFSRVWSPVAEYNLIFLRSQQSYANDKLNTRGHLFLNEVYDALDIPRTEAGALTGWVRDGEGDGYVDFGIFDDTNDMARAFVNGHEGSILLDFNVDGLIHDKI